MTDPAYHTPVMPGEVVRLLEPRPGQVFVDGTLGGGGHAALLAERLEPGGTLVGIDRDPAALEAARERLRPISRLRIVLVHDDFRHLAAILDGAGIQAIDGLLLDLGVSSRQLSEADGRGFSFRADAPLDMRMDPTRGRTAAQLLAEIGERELADLLWELGDERFSRQIARRIVARRAEAPVRTTGDLAELVRQAIPPPARPRTIHPATRVFQALRMAVNGEIDALRQVLIDGVDRLAAGGRIAVLSYHSGEDRVVKNELARMSGRCQCPPGLPACRCGARRVVDVLTRKPVMPSETETQQNRRARSARLRAARKVAG